MLHNIIELMIIMGKGNTLTQGFTDQLFLSHTIHEQTLLCPLIE